MRYFYPGCVRPPPHVSDYTSKIQIFANLCKMTLQIKFKLLQLYTKWLYKQSPNFFNCLQNESTNKVKIVPTVCKKTAQKTPKLFQQSTKNCINKVQIVPTVYKITTQITFKLFRQTTKICKNKAQKLFPLSTKLPYK